MSEIFLSYNREDQTRARTFAQALEAEGFSVWWDVGLRTGEAYDEVTENALRGAKAVVVLWSKRSVASRWVRAEATLAHRNNTFLPCMIEPCERPIMFELTQTADLSHWRGDPEDAAWRAFAADVRMFVEDGPEARAAFEAVRVNPSTHASRALRLPLVGAVSRRWLIAAAAGVGVIGIGGLALLRRPNALAQNGVAVLPFRNVSGDPGQDYLSIGLSSEVRSVLARNSALRVVAQASSEAVKERALGAAEMANALAVAFLLDGNVRKQGGNLRVGAELIDGRTGFSQWSATFERPMNEMVTVQDAIADAVTAELSLTRSAASADDKYGASKNAAAYNDYFKGEELYSAALSNETDLAALAHFDRAIERDPEFGAAHAARARSLTSLGNTSDDVVKARLYYESAQVAARRAVDFGPASADAHSTLGYVLFQALLRVADAKEPYQRSYELGRGNATVLARFAGYAASTRRFAEAEKAVLRARDLDPLNATIQRAVGFVLYASGRYEDANEAVRRALSLNPKLSDSHARIGMGLIALGQSVAAIEAAKNEKSGMVRYPCLAIAHHLTGDADAAKSAMAALIDAYGDAGLYQQAQVLAQWGDADNAMAVLKRAHELGDSGLTYLYIDPALDPVRERPDFKVLLRALGYV